MVFLKEFSPLYNLQQKNSDRQIKVEKAIDLC